ncbi:hypothetical protein BDK51DRAFT_45559 [Blyttiomyces helicus]|uniref:Uncharacterized protein n=1 Tax=Blyttiomyces helicus TaxID=388810 RepID=A0A4P9WGR8_9FUNG|nr:hypothetical protein BDK51DRAFT_45559 [Blyttiomyces helicus]|eukprot:RKO91542.1 hypothetical protein BDK51DRAFT_45559 [Blyttiomyces helicus]
MPAIDQLPDIVDRRVVEASNIDCIRCRKPGVDEEADGVPAVPRDGDGDGRRGPLLFLINVGLEWLGVQRVKPLGLIHTLRRQELELFVPLTNIPPLARRADSCEKLEGVQVETVERAVYLAHAACRRGYTFGAQPSGAGRRRRALGDTRRFVRRAQSGGGKTNDMGSAGQPTEGIRGGGVEVGGGERRERERRRYFLIEGSWSLRYGYGSSILFGQPARGDQDGDGHAGGGENPDGMPFGGKQAMGSFEVRPVCWFFPRDSMINKRTSLVGLILLAGGRICAVEMRGRGERRDRRLLEQKIRPAAKPMSGCPANLETQPRRRRQLAKLKRGVACALRTYPSLDPSITIHSSACGRRQNLISALLTSPFSTVKGATISPANDRACQEK